MLFNGAMVDDLGFVRQKSQGVRGFQVNAAVVKRGEKQLLADVTDPQAYGEGTEIIAGRTHHRQLFSLSFLGSFARTFRATWT